MKKETHTDLKEILQTMNMFGEYSRELSQKIKHGIAKKKKLESKLE